MASCRWSSRATPPSASALRAPSSEPASVDIEALRERLAGAPTVRTTGRVLGVTGLSLRFVMPGVRVGDVVTVRRRGDPLACEIVGFDRGEAIGMPLGALAGVGPDDAVEATGGPLQVRASRSLLGRVVDGLGRPLDGGLPVEGVLVAVDRDPPAALGATARRPPARDRRARPSMACSRSAKGSAWVCSPGRASAIRN